MKFKTGDYALVISNASHGQHPFFDRLMSKGDLIRVDHETDELVYYKLYFCEGGEFNYIKKEELEPYKPRYADGSVFTLKSKFIGKANPIANYPIGFNLSRDEENGADRGILYGHSIKAPNGIFEISGVNIVHRLPKRIPLFRGKVSLKYTISDGPNGYFVSSIGDSLYMNSLGYFEFDRPLACVGDVIAPYGMSNYYKITTLGPISVTANSYKEPKVCEFYLEAFDVIKNQLLEFELRHGIATKPNLDNAEELLKTLSSKLSYQEINQWLELYKTHSHF